METVTEKKFLTEDELKQLKEIQSQTQSIVLELGEIELLKIQLEERSLVAREYLQELAIKEKEYTKNIFEKYGRSNVDPTTGEIIKID